MIEVKESKQKECKYAEYDMEGKHCNNPRNPDRLYTVSNKQCDNCELKETNAEEEQNVHSGITLDLEKISFHELCNLRDMVDEELSSRRNEQDRLVEEFRSSLEDLIDSDAHVFFREDNNPVQSFFDFSIYYKN